VPLPLAARIHERSIDLLHVLCRLIALENAQADLLNRICEGPLRGAEELRAAGAFTLPEVTGASKRKGKNQKQSASVGCGDKSGEGMHGPAISRMIDVIRHMNRARNGVFAPTRLIPGRRAG